MIVLLALVSSGLTNMFMFGDQTFVIMMQVAADSYTLLADPAGGAGMAAINAKVNEIVASLKTVGRPVAILGMVLLALSWLAAGILPDWAQQNKGLLVKMLMGGILLGIAPDVVSLVLPA